MRLTNYYNRRALHGIYSLLQYNLLVKNALQNLLCTTYLRTLMLFSVYYVYVL